MKYFDSHCKGIERRKEEWGRGEKSRGEKKRRFELMRGGKRKDE